MHNDSDKCNCRFLAGTLNSRNSKFQKKFWIEWKMHDKVSWLHQMEAMGEIRDLFIVFLKH